MPDLKYYEDVTKRNLVRQLPDGATPLPMEMSLSDHLAYFNAMWLIDGQVSEKEAEAEKVNPFSGEPEPTVRVSHVLEELVRSLELSIKPTAPWHSILNVVVNRFKNAKHDERSDLAEKLAARLDLHVGDNANWEAVLNAASDAMSDLVDRMNKKEQKTRDDLAEELAIDLVLNVDANSTWATTIRAAKTLTGDLSGRIEQQRSDLQAAVDPDEEETDYSFTNLLYMVNTRRKLLNKVFQLVGTTNLNLVAPKITEIIHAAQSNDSWKQMMSDELIDPTEPGDRLLSKDQAVKAIKSLKVKAYSSEPNNWMQEISVALGAQDMSLGDCVDAIKSVLQENKAYDVKVRGARRWLGTSE